MAQGWIAFYLGDYYQKTGELTPQEHGCYCLLIFHYYATKKPLPANAERLHNICRCKTVADEASCDYVVKQFFVLDGEVYRHDRIDAELSKAQQISEVRRHSALVKQGRKLANALANEVQKTCKSTAFAEQLHTQSQSQSQSQSYIESSNKESDIYVKSSGDKDSRATPCIPRITTPSIQEIKEYCQSRRNDIDPEKFWNFYETTGWMRGKNKIRDWKACVRTWEGRQGMERRNGNGTGNKQIDRLNRNAQRIVNNLGISHSQDADADNRQDGQRVLGYGNRVLEGSTGK